MSTAGLLDTLQVAHEELDDSDDIPILIDQPSLQFGIVIREGHRLYGDPLTEVFAVHYVGSLLAGADSQICVLKVFYEFEHCLLVVTIEFRDFDVVFALLSIYVVDVLLVVQAFHNIYPFFSIVRRLEASIVELVIWGGSLEVVRHSLGKFCLGCPDLWYIHLVLLFHLSNVSVIVQCHSRELRESVYHFLQGSFREFRSEDRCVPTSNSAGHWGGSCSSPR